MIFQESRFRSALKVLSTAPAAAANIDDVKMDEFVIAEQVKKFLVLKYNFFLTYFYTCFYTRGFKRE